ncbi:probable membrane metalloprotease ARASP2, chloroplastic [Arabidopsis lyrata subsp. lyrata]|uniref:probable membrane metalloprotease ARASP2, chloroplastic n=1 Tax=Arabidopsis lyrata subsp. lyrata TaxID=81972 RepID=UPI000A29A65D|nr:probable membrane metalloprotease ARASP2, chloroplastic [Arabidopsis lyrata subsp. lyrata]|eukprot:XP_020867248.1 probable membrane metalloprotease ARASP2, chloroplastic [Arabidopsis lyrata subsp. lyrata]
MLLSISSSPISHRIPHFLSTFNNPTSNFPPKSHLSTNLSTLSNHSFYGTKNRALLRNKRYPYYRTRALAGFDFGSFESVLEASAVLAAIIVVHETGHFLAASLQGGFVGFPDNDPDSGIPLDDKNLLKNRPILDRVIVVSAGIVANVIFAYAIIFTQVVSVGLPVQESFPGVLVPDVKSFSAASRDGLLPGDVILAVDGTELSNSGSDSVSKVVDVVKRNPEHNVLLRIERGKENFEIRITPDKSFDGTGKVGVQLSPNVRFSKVRPKNIPETLSFAGREFFGLSYNVLDSLKQTFLNFSQTASKVAGPVAIIAVGAEVARSNADGLYQFAALLNLNLAVINLLPLPALDGGTLALILLEAVRDGRKLPLEVEQGIMSSGIMLVLFLGLFLIVKDTLNLDFIKEML